MLHFMLVLKSPSQTLTATQPTTSWPLQHFPCPLGNDNAPSQLFALFCLSKAGNSPCNPPKQTMNGGAKANAPELDVTQPQAV